MPPKTAKSTKLRAEINQRFVTIDKLLLETERLDKLPTLDSRDNFHTLLNKTNAHELMEQLLANINNWISMQKPNSDDYNMGLIMKASALRHKVMLEPMLYKQIGLLNQAIEVVEDIREKSEGFNVYMNSMMVLFEMYREQGDSKKTKQILFKAKSVYDHFIKNPNKLVWDYYSVFKGTPPTPEKSESSKRYFRLYLGNCLHYFYRNEDPAKDQMKIAEYIVPALQYLELRFRSAQPFPYKMYEKMTHIIKDLLQVFRYKQLDHCLAGLMFHLVRYRRDAPTSNRKEISALQYRVASLFTIWGGTIAEFSIGKLQNEELPPIDNETYEELDIFKVPGVEIYANQFPINLVNSEKEIKKIINKVHQWDKKTEELSKESGEGNWIVGENFAVKELNINLLAMKIKNLQKDYNFTIEFRGKNDIFS